jgi:hypothetical protein
VPGTPAPAIKHQEKYAEVIENDRRREEEEKAAAIKRREILREQQREWKKARGRS